MSLLMRTPAVLSSFNLNYICKDPYSHTVTLGLGFRIWIGTQIFSPHTWAQSVSAAQRLSDDGHPSGDISFTLYPWDSNQLGMNYQMKSVFFGKILGYDRVLGRH